MAAINGLDFIMIDCEHGPADVLASARTWC
jgi:hypothetical protein